MFNRDDAWWNDQMFSGISPIAHVPMSSDDTVKYDNRMESLNCQPYFTFRSPVLILQVTVQVRMIDQPLLPSWE